MRSAGSRDRAIGQQGGVRFARGQLECGDERSDFHILLPSGRGPAPFVLCLPILAGGEELMWWIGTSLAELGYAVAWNARVASALRAGQRGPQLERLLQRTLLHNRMLLAWARRQPELDDRRLGTVGISMGGMVGAALMAVEPDLRAAALCLAGGDLPDLLLVSAEARARDWRAWRLREDGLVGIALRDELRAELVSDPARLGPYVGTDEVLLIGGAFDEVVPPHFQDVLWESLGRPRRLQLPVGHYTSAVAFSALVSAIDAFLRERFASPSEPPPAALPAAAAR